MKTLIAGLTILVASSLFLSSALHAQQGPPRDHARYDPATVETIAGTVVAVEMHVPPQGNHYGVHLQVQAGEETLPIHLGPSWYLERQDTHLQEGDEIEVTGSRITYEGAPAIIAAQVKRSEDTLHLRDAEGYPAWRGWRHGTRRDHNPRGMQKGQPGAGNQRQR